MNEYFACDARLINSILVVLCVVSCFILLFHKYHKVFAILLDDLQVDQLEKWEKDLQMSFDSNKCPVGVNDHSKSKPAMCSCPTTSTGRTYNLSGAGCNIV